MFAARLGEIAALGTAVCWTATALSFESAGKRIGSLTVNLIRLGMATILFLAYGLIVRGAAFPIDATPHAWGWLALSGLVGFVIGDLLLFQAFVEIGARISMLVFASVPPLTAIMARFALDERLTPLAVGGMLVTLFGIVLVVLKRPPESTPALPGRQAVTPSADSPGGPGHDAPSNDVTADVPPPRTVDALPAVAPPPPATRIKGVMLAFGGAMGQAGGVILGRIGAGTTMDPFAASQIRALVGLVGFAIVFFVARRWKQVFRALGNRPAMGRVALGATFGPFLGVSLGLLAVQNTSAGIASTITAIVPVLIIAPSVIIFKEKVTVREIVGAVIAVAGVAILVL